MKLILSNDQAKVLYPSAEMKELAKNERMKNAFKKFILFFVCALFSIFIPMLHFFLVPGFLILSIVMAKKEYEIKYIFTLKDCTCAHCEKTMAGVFKVSDSMRLQCNQCFTKYLVEV